MPRRSLRARLLFPVAVALLGASLVAPAESVATAFPSIRPVAPTQAPPVPPDPGTGGGRSGSVLRGGLADLAALAAAGHLGVDRLGTLAVRSGAAGRELAVSIETNPDRTNAVIDAVDAMGGHIANRDGAALEAYVPVPGLASLAAIPGITDARPVLPPVPLGFVNPGVALHGADAWQAAGYTGHGVKVGIIDGGFDAIASRLGVELPSTVHARCYSSVGVFSSAVAACETATDHGTAVAETISAMAPGASLWIADPISVQDFTSTVSWMTSNGVRIINSSLGFAFEGPGDGSDPTKASIYTALNQATAAGALWVNASGNAGEDGWTGPWTDANGNDRLDFAPGDEGDTIQLAAGQPIVATLRWNDAWGHSGNDYNLFLNGPFSSSPVAGSTDGQTGSGDPVESFAYTAPVSGTYSLSVVRHSGKAVTRLQLLVLTTGESPLEHQTVAGTLPAPADSANPAMLTVGAVDVAEPATIEPYSSRGPTVDGRSKPDLVAGDCAPTSVEDPFCGTSQAAPFVAGAAALVLEASPTLTAAQLASWLKEHATPLGSSTPNSTFGWGRLNLGAPVLPASALAFATQPGGPAAAGVELPVQPVVRVVDRTGATVSSGAGATTRVTLALAATPGGASLACTGGLARTAVAGVAAFTGCAVSTAGAGYTLIASATGLAAVTSAPFEVGPAPPPPHPALTFASSPGSGVASVPLSPQPTVRVIDAATGLPLSTGAAATAPVTLSLSGGTPGATLTCSGGLTRTPVGGVAAFHGCVVSGAGTGFVLHAGSASAAAATTAPLDLVPGTPGPPSSLSLTTSAAAIAWGQPAPLAVRLTVPAGASSPAGRTVRLEASLNGSDGWQTVGSGVTGANGSASIAYRPATNLWYRAFYDGAADLAGAGSAVVRITVRQLALLRPAPARTTIVAAGSATTFVTTIRPSSATAPAGSATFQLWRLVGSRWVLAASRVVATDGAGQATFRVTWGAGSWYVRSMANPTPRNANSAWTPPVRYDAR